MKRSREYFDSSGLPEDPGWIQKHETAALAAAGKESVVSPALERTMGKIDFDSLRRMFEERAKRAGVDPQRMNFIEGNRILFVKPNVIESAGLAISSYDPRENNIRLSEAQIKNFLGDERVCIELGGLAFLCHEESHATSHTECRGLREFEEGKLDNAKGDMLGIKSGYNYNPVKREGRVWWSNEFFKYFDEGVTEKLGQEVFEEYLEAHPGYASPGDIAKFRKKYDALLRKVYEPWTTFVDALIVRISSETGLDGKTVWQGFVRGKMDGENLNDKELDILFSEMFSPDFLEKLAVATSPRELIKRLEERNSDKARSPKGLGRKIKSFFLKDRAA